MPITATFRQRLYPHLAAIAERFGTPFYVYDESGIRSACSQLRQAFSHLNHQQYFAVKALPNPHILAIMQDEGCGFDCSSIAELAMARSVGAAGSQIFFTSNNTTTEEFQAAMEDKGVIINLDAPALIANLPALPSVVCCRYNPGHVPGANSIIGLPAESKFGMRHDQVVAAFQQLRAKGITRFGLHSMVVSNERHAENIVYMADLLLQLAARLKTTCTIDVEFINIGGGFGIPYQSGETSLDTTTLGQRIAQLINAFEQSYGWRPKVFTECGRYVTGPHGVLVTRVINRKTTYRTCIGVDASMPALMRPGMYGAYHMIEAPYCTEYETETVDVVGSLCENNDKFAVQRTLPRTNPGDLLVIHDAGAHGHSMGFNYNGRLRPKELLLQQDSTVRLIRRAETIQDYLATLQFMPETYQLM
jgi:diaminopimelate decarboxylase